MKSYVEHLNITVPDLDESIRFVQTAMPDFKVRRRFQIDGRKWAHVGTDTTYLAMIQADRQPEARPQAQRMTDMDKAGFNHVGFVVENLDAVRERLLSAGFAGGYNNGEIIEAEYRRSAYFLDVHGSEFEFMQYLSDKPEERNIYDV